MPETRDEASGGTPRRSRILVVEDEYFVALDVEHRLKQAGYDVVGIADTAMHAIRIAEKERPDLAIMDIRLAGARDGTDVAIELRERLGIPSIFATAHGDEATKRRAEQARPLGWLQKPYSPEALIILVRKALASLT